MPGTPDLIAAYEDLEAARPAYEEADQMYSGDVGEVFASERIKLLLKKARADEVEEFNYAHIPVDTIANRLEITAFTAVEPGQDDGEDDDGAETTAAKAAPPTNGGRSAKDGDTAPAKVAKRTQDAQKALDQLVKDNQLDAELNGLHHKVSRAGDCYLIVWPATDDNGKIASVDLRVNDALTTRVIYDDEDPLEIAYGIKSWTYDEDVKGKKTQFTRATLYYDDRVERWISKPGKKGKALCDPDAWDHYEPTHRDGEGRQPWLTKHDYGRVPVFHYRNDRPYGKPEHLYAYGPQQMLNKLVMAQSAAIDFQSFPQRYLLMDPSADQVMGNLMDPNHPEDDDDPEGAGNASQLSADAAAVWRLFGAKSAGQFDPASPDAFLKPFDRFVQAMAELTETPLYRFGSAFAQTPSGTALRAADAPTVNRVDNRKAAYEPTHDDALSFALELLGHKDIEVKVSWKPAEQATDFEAWSVVQQKIDAGVPKRQALIEAGYSEDQVDEWLKGESSVQESMLKKVDLLNSVAGALQSIGAAVAMNVVNEEQAQTLIAGLLGDVKQAADTAKQADAADEG